MEDLEVICRVCLKIFSEENLSSISHEPMDTAEKIFLISGIFIIADELMPKKICLECIDNLNSAYTLREMIIKSDRFLQEINSVEFAIVEENSEIVEQIEEFVEEEDYGEEYLDEFMVDAENEALKNKRQKNNSREPCYVCAKLISKRNMQLHLKTHSDHENYMCDLCGEAFKMKSYLYSHIENRHKKIRKFQCHCGKAYNKRNTYEMHLKTHTGENLDSFKCKLCTKSFALKSRLKVHLRIHQGSRPYECDFEGCSKTFIHKTDLRRHIMAQHTLERPHKCFHCNKGFVKRSQLQSHSKRCS